MPIAIVRVRITSTFVGAAGAVYLFGLAASCGSGGAASSASSTSSGSAGGGGAATQACSEPSEKAFTLADVSHVDPFTSKGEYSSRLAVAANGTMAIMMQGHPASLPTRVGVRFSKDKGETWGPVLLPDVPEGFVSTDPNVTVDADGGRWGDDARGRRPDRRPRGRSGSSDQPCDNGPHR